MNSKSTALHRLGASFFATCLLLALGQGPVSAHDEPVKKEYGWFNALDFALVMTNGNAEAESLSFRNSLSRVWEDAIFTLDAGALQSESSTIRRFATGNVNSFNIIEEKTTQTTAENYFLRGRYDHQINESLFWYTGLGWERNEFAGFDSRFQGVAGLGNIWFADDNAHFSTYYGVTWTKQDDIIENPSVKDDFVGLQLGWDYGRKLSTNTTFDHTLVIDANTDETDDWRLDSLNSVTTQMSQRLALKVSLQLLYDNMPSLASIELLDAAGLPTGTTVVGQLDELDTLFTAALVITF